MVTTSAKVKGKASGKQSKKFLEQKAPLRLASIIGQQQETKAKAKVDKHHRHDKEPERTEQKARSSAKDKLKEVKTALKAEKAKTKKEKAKARKQDTKQQSRRTSGSATQQPNTESTSTRTSKPRRRVAFA
ncbi:uncharacterized protein PHACADRAFT_196188 [Phanerochaete carnosa HHB-10118-sp]|uniref:Uncharacterized protein n=1 Tax=Phanerochaete carnosa (strain HHB-10118-sp) TaxID=650164 RepID=K5V0X7_PHACS|nr:uncharacterized protein PHACADRAFT_196188 [Phanerochaete carnosa HHB-10118-sp]EKM56136.1 hypothetical protein PHACADRAFT_196188 [Phanerochaete carnosa HHB-10118-sp]